MANVLVIGAGGREHAICWKLAQSQQVKTIFVSPCSHAIAQLDKVMNVCLDIKNHQKLVDWSKAHDVKLVVIGPEDPLANGIGDAFHAAGISCFGPGKDGARIEAYKDWSKAFMDRHQVPTARWKSFTDANEAKHYINNANFPALVVKASGLAAGKGVVVAPNKEAACLAVDEILTTKKFGIAGDVVVVEELLEGEEVSVLAFCDGKTIKAMLPAQDHKRIFEGDMGPNTGGMGAYCPCPFVDERHMNFIEKEILERTVQGLQKENIRYIGVLYAGLMMTRDGPKVLEFNCRFGDPETEVLLPMLESDLFEIMTSCCNGTLHERVLRWRKNVSAVGVVMASHGYPETSSKGQEITNLDLVTQLHDHFLFHCGTKYNEETEHYETNGGRVLIAVVIAQHLATAAGKASRCCSEIRFDGAQYRKDIAHKGIARSILQSGKLTYKCSGVDIIAGDSLVSHIKPAAKSTNRTGVMGGLGGFGGLFDIKASGFKDPILVSGTDGVGTKLKIAQVCNKHDTIGIDLVAMCVNDVLAHGAEPLFFLDYFACGILNVDVAKQVVSGVAEGCRQAGCALIGGETAEMPSMYPPGEYDVAGFAVGAVERSQMIPNIEQIEDGDLIIGLPSSGVHSNGFSLVRRVLLQADANYTDKAPFSITHKTFGEELLTPTKIYVKSVLPAVRSGHVKAFAHITGGGLTENIPRVLPKHLGVVLDAKKWTIPTVFAWLAAMGGINEAEMLRTFNCGIGAILIVPKKSETEIMKLLSHDKATIIGQVKPITQSQVIVQNFANAMDPLMRRYIPKLVVKSAPTRKRVGVLISGTGTNLQSLIDATLDPMKHVGAEIVLVLSNKADVEGLKRAERANIPTKVLKHTDYKSRDEFDQAMQTELLNANVDLICLAGFMRILTPTFVNSWKGRLLNIHPALLPSFKGTHAQRQALESGVRVSGCTVHFVEADVDAGAIIVQEVVPVEMNDTENDLIERIKTAEHKAYPRALQLVATGKVTLGSNNQIVWNYI